MVTVVHVPGYVLFLEEVSVIGKASKNVSQSMYIAMRKTLVCPHLLAAAS